MTLLKLILFSYLLSCVEVQLLAAHLSLSLPPRATNALSGSAFVRLISDLPFPKREETIFDQIAQGNVPEFLRTLVPVPIQAETTNALIYVTPDYLAVGSDDDYFLTPMRPSTAQRIADL